jgi:hypothetical protein
VRPLLPRLLPGWGVTQAPLSRRREPETFSPAHDWGMLANRWSGMDFLQTRGIIIIGG